MSTRLDPCLVTLQHQSWLPFGDCQKLVWDKNQSCSLTVQCETCRSLARWMLEQGTPNLGSTVSSKGLGDCLGPRAYQLDILNFGLQRPTFLKEL